MTGILARLRDAILPWPDRVDEIEAQRIAAETAADVDAVGRTDWSKQTEVALAEAIRIVADETARRQGADTKSSTYLVVVAALVPIIAAIQVAIWESKAGPAPRWASLGVAEIATVYVALGGFWSLRALHVTVIDCVDVEDVLAAWERRDPRQELVRRMLSGARRTRSAIDLKLSHMLLAQDYLFRGFLALATLLLLNAAFYFALLLWPGGAASKEARRTVATHASPASRATKAAPSPSATLPIARSPRTGRVHQEKLHLSNHPATER